MASRNVLPTHEQMLRELVASPSMSSTDPAWDRSNRGVVERLAAWADALGAATEILEIPGAPDKLNLIARFGEGEEGLVLSGHTDTVPYDEDQWATNPLELVEKEGALYGLGSADMKGFFASALHAIAQAGTLRRPVVLLGTADEESGMEGAQAIANSGLALGSHAVIGEPTSLRPVHMHKGVMLARLTLEGRAGHASDPSLGLSALDGMIELGGELIALRDELVARFHDEAFSVPNPTLNLGRIAGGDSPNRICGHCVLDVDLRLLPGMQVAEVRALIEARLLAVAGRRGLRARLESLADPLPPFATPLDAMILRVATEVAGLPPVSVLFGTEGPYLAQLGLATVVLGPGSIDVAHQANEHVHRAELARATDVYGGIIHRICVDAA